MNIAYDNHNDDSCHLDMNDDNDDYNDHIYSESDSYDIDLLTTTTTTTAYLSSYFELLFK